MPPEINGKGQWAVEYSGPYGGVNVQTPENLIPDNATPSMSNFMLRNSELRSAPAFVLKFDAPNNGNILGIGSFRDINGKFHTILWEELAIYQYNPLTPTPPWDVITGTSPALGPNPVSYRAFANQMWFTNVLQFNVVHGVNNPVVAHWDGITAGFVATQTQYDASVTQSAAGIAAASSPAVSGTLAQFFPNVTAPLTGPISIGAQYLGELNNQLILANVSIYDQASGAVFSLPNLVWWSANGLPLEWDPTHNTSAGFNALLDVPDQITGLATLGVAGYIFRSNGITQFSPTGSAIAPFQFNHMWSSEHGIGNVFPWSVAQYGSHCAFAAEDNIYYISVANAEAIGGDARDAIMADLAANLTIPSNVEQRPVAAIIPQFVSGYVYLTYQLCIPVPKSGGIAQRIWNYSVREKHWEVWDVPPFVALDQQYITAAPNYV